MVLFQCTPAAPHTNCLKLVLQAFTMEDVSACSARTPADKITNEPSQHITLGEYQVAQVVGVVCCVDRAQQKRTYDYNYAIEVAESEFTLQAPSSICYVPNFVTEDEEQYIIDRILSSPKPKWQTLSNRRLQNWGGVVGKKALIKCDDIPMWLQSIVDRITHNTDAFDCKANSPNHVLVNEYEPGQGIMPHTDGPAFHPVITTVSLGAHTMLDFYTPITHEAEDITNQPTDVSHASLKARHVGRLYLAPRSLVVIRDQAYTTLLHGIQETTSDSLENQATIFNADRYPQFFSDANTTTLKRNTRYSLTIRNVPKVCTAAFNILTGRR